MSKKKDVRGASKGPGSTYESSPKKAPGSSSDPSCEVRPRTVVQHKYVDATFTHLFRINNHGRRPEDHAYIAFRIGTFVKIPRRKPWLSILFDEPFIDDEGVTVFVHTEPELFIVSGHIADRIELALGARKNRPQGGVPAPRRTGAKRSLKGTGASRATPTRAK